MLESGDAVNSCEMNSDLTADLTSLLYAQPSFLEGCARALDLWGTMTEFNESLNPEQADYLALRADWLSVGNDIRRAMRAFSRDSKAA